MVWYYNQHLDPTYFSQKIVQFPMWLTQVVYSDRAQQRLGANSSSKIEIDHPRNLCFFWFLNFIKVQKTRFDGFLQRFFSSNLQLGSATMGDATMASDVEAPGMYF